MENIAVIGSGTMGIGIAQTFAAYGFEVGLYDVSAPALTQSIEVMSQSLDRMVRKETMAAEDKEATLSRIHLHYKLKEAVDEAQIVVEAATENKSLKLNLFKELSTLSGQDTILATNTSSISITELAAATDRAHKVIGMHFMNPVPLMKLVEVVRGFQTSEETVSQIKGLTTALEKVPVVSQDYPGFIANRILMPMINEAIFCLFEGVAGVWEIDEVMKLGMSHPMGPLRLADFIGLDVCLAVMQVLFDGFKSHKYAPCPLLVNMVHSGSFGIKSGQGFYAYSTKTKEIHVSANFAKEGSKWT